MPSKIYTLFAGVNGVGKSTLYNFPKFQGADLGVRINTDELLRSFGDWNNPADQSKAARLAIIMRNTAFKQGLSLNQETTLTGKGILKSIDKAKEKGYQIHLYYVGVNSPKIPIERIATRVAKGGHGIPNDVVEKRYYESIKNLNFAFQKADYSMIYDNSSVFIPLLEKNGKEIYFNQKIRMAHWVQNFIRELSVERQFNGKCILF